MDKISIFADHTGMPHYQVYYWTGLSGCAHLTVQGAPWWYRLVPKPDLALDFESIYQRLTASIGLGSQWDPTQVEQFVASYQCIVGHREVRFAIDSHDGKEIFSPELLESTDIYFKVNKWRGESYPDNVLPLVNGNGFLRHRHLDRLRAMRGTAKNRDFLFISRIWGGVEHNVRLFESLSTLPCRKRLMAIFVEGAAGKIETQRAIERLESVGVECSFKLLPIKNLWRETSESKVVMIRAGKYMCIPWRMIDLLCMGACLVTDGEFEPQWPEPLIEGTHYLSGGIKRPFDTSAANSEEYEKLADKVLQITRDEDSIRRLQRNSADYFDNHAAPQRVGEYILSCLKSKML